MSYWREKKEGEKKAKKKWCARLQRLCSETQTFIEPSGAVRDIWGIQQHHGIGERARLV
jgi:hypothetical protein